MASLRNDIMQELSDYRKLHDDNARAQAKDTTRGLIEALTCSIRADAVNGIAMRIHAILDKHGE